MTPQTAFWLSAGVLTAIALGLLLRPLLGRNARATGNSWDALAREHARQLIESYDEQHRRGELDDGAHEAALAELLEELDADEGVRPPEPPPATDGKYAGWLVALAVPIGAVFGYLSVGSPDALDTGARPDPVQNVAEDPRIPHSVAGMVEQLEQRLAAEPEDPEGWFMLGRSYAAMNRLPDARAALDEALARRPAHAATLVAQAEVMAGLAGDRLDAQTMRLIHRALEIDPRFPRALWLAGVYAFRGGDPATALAFFERIRAAGTLPAEEAMRLDEAIGRARAAAGTAPSAVLVAGAPARIEVTVRVSDELATDITPGDTVFVFARAAQGPRIPLAVARLGAGGLPLDVTLDDSLAMRPELRLSAFDTVVVGARVSRSGSATPVPGDITAKTVTAPSRSGARLELVLDRRVP